MKPEMKKLIIANLPYLLFVYGSEYHIHSGGKNCGNAEAGGEKTEGARRSLLPRFHRV